MTREEAIERYDRIRYNLLNREDKAAVDVAFDALREQEGLENSYAQLQAGFDQIYESNMAMGKALREQPRWISVEERLPKEKGRYLIASKFSGHIFAEIISWTPQYDGHEEYLQGKAIWFDYDSEYGDYEYTGVTHWMPLPEPPKEEA